MTVTFKRNKRLRPAVLVQSSGCDSAVATLSRTTINFQQAWVNDLMTNCGPRLNPDQSNWIYGKILTNEVNWSIKQGQLTVTKAGEGSLVFER